MRKVGWLLDVYVDGSQAVSWFKLEDGGVLRLLDPYTPDFIVKPKSTISMDGLARILLEHPSVIRAEPESWFTSLDRKRKVPVLHVWVNDVKNYWRTIVDCKKLRLIEAYYNVARRGDLLHVQKYLFHRGYVPTAKVEIEYSRGRLSGLSRINDDLDVKPPPFTALPFEIEPRWWESPSDDGSISGIAILDEHLERETLIEGDEGEILTLFSDYIADSDPDFLVAPDIRGGLSRIVERAKALGANLQLGRETREVRDDKWGLAALHRGRILLDMHTFRRIGIAGVVERARFTMAPPELSAEWQAGHTIDSRQGYEALKRRVLLPRKREFYSYMLNVRDLALKDRGGIVFAPEAGIHENVGALDFESMFPNIIDRFNVSYETTTPGSIDRSIRGFLGDLTRSFLKRRSYFKRLRSRYPRGSIERLWCEQRQTALKGILVCIYGFSGCFANRFSDVAVFQEINRIARESLLRAANLAMKEGFRLVYGDTDSLFLKRRNASRKDYERLAEKISATTGLPINLEHHFKFLVFLNQESNPEMEATRRYFGKLTNGELYYRGIELRRRDLPHFLKAFQERLMEILFDAERLEDVETRRFKKACEYVAETVRRIRRGDIDRLDLTVSKVLGKPIEEYRSKIAHVVAAKQLRWRGRAVASGEKVELLYVNASHRNPFRRVVQALLIQDGRTRYDAEKYVDLALGAARTVLGALGFHRENLGL